LDRAEVRLTREPGEGKPVSIEMELMLGGDLDEEQRARLREVAARCPVHRTLMDGVRITHR
jgi:putative redox protein